MGKKKLKKMLRRAIKAGYGATTMNNAEGAAGGFGNAAGDGFGGVNQLNKGFLSGLGLPRGFASGQTEQFILGALLGGAAAYVLADEELRNKIMKAVMKVYAGLTGGIEEFKEQVADLKAEIKSEHGI